MRKALVRLALAVGLALSAICQASADERTDTLKALVRAKVAIETGVTASDFAVIVRQIDEQVQLARATRSRELSQAQLEATAAASEHLKRVSALWGYLLTAPQCFVQGEYSISDPSCQKELTFRLALVDLKLGETVDATAAAVTMKSIMGPALEKAHQRVGSAIDLLAAR